MRSIKEFLLSSIKQLNITQVSLWIRGGDSTCLVYIKINECAEKLFSSIFEQQLLTRTIHG